MASTEKTEPKLEDAVVTPPAVPVPEPVAVTIAVPVAPVQGAVPKLDQLSRVEDKTARIEEKFARSEERMMRLESALEKATIRLEGATQDMNLQGVRQDIASMREDLRRKPGSATIFIIALVAALLGAAASFALLKFGIPGILPR
ncbi:MAG: hypothetical protein ACRCUE_07380 [Bosea sp. (in: a-proteobacteria)]